MTFGPSPLPPQAAAAFGALDALARRAAAESRGGGAGGSPSPSAAYLGSEAGRAALEAVLRRGWDALRARFAAGAQLALPLE